MEIPLQPSINTFRWLFSCNPLTLMKIMQNVYQFFIPRIYITPRGHIPCCANGPDVEGDFGGCSTVLWKLLSFFPIDLRNSEKFLFQFCSSVVFAGDVFKSVWTAMFPTFGVILDANIFLFLMLSHIYINI